MSYESTAEPVKVGYLMDFTLPPGFPEEMPADFTRCFAAKYDGRRPVFCVPVVNRDVAAPLVRAITDSHPLSPCGVKEALERLKMMPAASGAPGTGVSFGKWSRRASMGPGYLVARTLDADGVNSHLVDRFGEEG